MATKKIEIQDSNGNVYYPHTDASVVANMPKVMKNPNALTISLNGTSQGAYDGSAAKSINITPGNIGAAAASHGNHVPTPQTANNKKFLRNDNTWQDVTPGNIGAYTKSEIDTKVSNINASLNHNTQNINDNANKIEKSLLSIKNDTLYSSALKNLSQIYDLNYCKNAIKNGELRIAVVGDSITEGANNYYNDVWINRFISSLNKLYPSLTINFCNFALGGRNSTQFVDTNYKAVNPETDITQHFWRSWATVGKSWIDSVCDYKADLVIYAMGINDVGGIYNMTFYNNVASAINYIKSKNPATDFALVTPLESTRVNTSWSGDENENLCFARIIREFAKNSNYALIDTHRLWRILLHGIDDENFYNKELTSIADINKEISYNFNANITFSSTTYPTNKDIYLRKFNNRYLIIRFTVLDNQNCIQLYRHDGSLINTWTNTPQQVNISVEGSKITVNNESFYYYSELYNGSLDFSALSGNISSIYFNNRKVIQENPSFDEKDLLGEITNPICQGLNGNGINHPTGLGHYLTYYMASKGLINSLERIKYADLATLTSKKAINLLQTEGEYYIYNATDSPSTNHVSGYVKVRRLPQWDNIYIHQTFYPYNSGGEFYTRIYNSSGWSNWFKFSGVEVTS